MTDRSPEVDDHSGIETTGHSWDGIKELNNPLPRWWLYVFYATVVISVVYWVLMPAWPALPGFQGSTQGVLRQSDRAEAAADVAALKSRRDALGARLAAVDAKSILADPGLREQALALGESTFNENCAACHGPGGRGAKGYPQLADDVWLWGGSLDNIERTIRFGVRSGDKQELRTDMPAFGRDELLAPAQISDLVDYVSALSHQAANQDAVKRAQPLFIEQCSKCHGEAGKGDVSRGIPNLTDADWLYGGDKATIRASLQGPRGGVMPAWGPRLDPATIRALAIYVHSLGGGQ